MIKFGIISFAHLHADGYARALKRIHAADESACLVGIADEEQARGQAKASEFGVKYFQHFSEMLAGAQVDAVIIMSENSQHAQAVCAAAEQSVHIICEKPVGAFQSDLDRMQAALAKDPVVFQTAFVCRYSPAVMETRAKLTTGEFGSIKAISATNHGQFPGGWFGDKSLSGGGAIIDHTVHAADLIRLFTGEEIGSVRAFQGDNIRDDLGVEDNALIYAQTEKSRIPISIDCSWSRHAAWPTWGDLTMTITCEKGVLQLDAFRPHIDVVAGNTLRWHGIGEDLNEKLIRAFCNAVLESRGQSPTPGSSASALDPLLRADFADGARAAEIAFAAYSSIDNNNEPVCPR